MGHTKGPWKLGDGTIYSSKRGGVLYDSLNDWLSKDGQQILRDLLNEGWDNKSFEEIEPVLRQRLVTAAAADLLEACEAYAKVEQLIKDKAPHKKVAEAIEEADRLNQKALAKAKGEVSNG